MYLYANPYENGVKMARVSTSCWFTNMPVAKHNEDLILYKHYSPEEYPEYEFEKQENTPSKRSVVVL